MQWNVWWLMTWSLFLPKNDHGALKQMQETSWGGFICRGGRVVLVQINCFLQIDALLNCRQVNAHNLTVVIEEIAKPGPLSRLLIMQFIIANGISSQDSICQACRIWQLFNIWHKWPLFFNRLTLLFSYWRWKSACVLTFVTLSEVTLK